MSLKTNQQVAKEFDDWVLDGKSKGMEHRHYFMWESIFKNGNFKNDSSVLDLCCGDGWAVYETAKKIKDGFVVGVDASAAMVGSAVAKRGNSNNTLFLQNDVQGLSFGENQFTHIFSIEALYYVKDISSLFKSVSRLLKPNGVFLIAINYYAENPHTTVWQSQIGIPLYSRSVAEYSKIMEENGLKVVNQKRIFEPSPIPEQYNGRWFKDINELKAFRKEGTLLLVGRKSNSN